MESGFGNIAVEILSLVLMRNNKIQWKLLRYFVPSNVCAYMAPVHFQDWLGNYCPIFTFAECPYICSTQLLLPDAISFRRL